MPLFERKKTVKDLMILSSSKSERDSANAVIAITKLLSNIKELLVDKSDVRITGKEKDQDLANSERARISEVSGEITTEMINLNMFLPLVDNIDKLEFESVKQVVDIFSHIFRVQSDNHLKYNLAANYLTSKPEVLQSLLNSYDKPKTIPHCGTILRDACRHEDVCRIVLSTPEFYKLFDHAQSHAFDVSSDAFTTIKELITKHKKMVSEFINANFETFFAHYQDLYLGENYMTKRQALKVLSEILLDGHNKAIMTKYISEPKNLKNIMNLLKNEKKQLAFEAFHCFKVFVVAPEKPKSIVQILLQNKQKLIEFLTDFHSERPDDGQLNSEKDYVIKLITHLTLPKEN